MIAPRKNVATCPTARATSSRNNHQTAVKELGVQFGDGLDMNYLKQLDKETQAIIDKYNQNNHL